MSLAPRAAFLVSVTAALLLAVFIWMGPAYGMRMLVEGACLAIIAIGLTVQWGYAGLFNAGLVGFIAVSAFAGTLVSFPVNDAFVALAGSGALAAPVAILLGGAGLTFAATRFRIPGLPGRLRALPALVAGVGTLLALQAALAPTIAVLEREREWIGGLGLPVWLGWLAGGTAAGVLGWAMGRITLGLRADYLAIATLGIAELVVAFLKNADWLTRGTVTVSPLPWPVPSPQELGFVFSRGLYLCVAATVIVAVYILVERAWASPWGRMMRAMRDNEQAAAAMGKDVDRRRLEIFVLGNIIVGIGGAMLVTSTSIFDPTSFSPLNHTFLIWVMVVVGGAGNNQGTVLGALLVYAIWTMSEPATLLLFQVGAEWAQQAFGWSPPADLHSRALQMRVFLIGLTIVAVLRFAPKGLLPEKTVRYE
jgi:branched-chain amino acid transport system permease protein